MYESAILFAAAPAQNEPTLLLNSQAPFILTVSSAIVQNRSRH